MKPKRRLRPIEIAMFFVPLCALAFASWRLLNKPRVVELPRYRITDVGALGRGGFVSDLNDKGEITGVWKSNRDGSWPQVFFWKDGKFTLLQAWAFRPRLDNNGTVVGSYYRNKSSPHFQWQNGKPRPRMDWPANSEIKDINDSGQVVSKKSNAFTQIDQAILLKKGQIYDLLIPDVEDISPRRINNKGEVIINSDDDAYFWSNGQVTLVARRNKNLPAEAIAMNNNGVVIGIRDEAGSLAKDVENWIWKDGRLSNLRKTQGVESFVVQAVNDQEAIVGLAITANNTFAMLYFENQIYNLEDLVDGGERWKLEAATAINNRGQIVGAGTLNGKRHFFLLTPQVPATSST